MITYLDRVTTAKHELDVDLDHHCSLCGKTAAAWVRGKAVVQENRSLLEMGASDAAFLAETEAQRNAALLVRIARCPACKQRDPGEMRPLVMRFVWAIVGVEAAHLLLAMLGSSSSFLTSYLRVWYPIAILLTCVMVGVGAKTLRDLRASDVRVRYIRETEETQGPYRSAS